MLEIVAGFDERQPLGFAVAIHSLLKHATIPVRITPLVLRSLRRAGLYRRRHEHHGQQLWDVISDAPMATSFACSRFLAPWLTSSDTEWALFCDFSDMVFCADVAELLKLADDAFAIMVVKHEHEPEEATKMDAQLQLRYRRKNWSSLILWNLGHPANSKLTLEHVNQLPGRTLHAFQWLSDDEIGELPPEWNVLIGSGREPRHPKLLHYTLGTPELGVETRPWSDAWHQELAALTSAGSSFAGTWPAPAAESRSAC
jgi:lipopolysaccharide biosynthesis glycosyltransferase